MTKVYTPLLGVRHETQPNSAISAMLSGGSITLSNDNGLHMTFRLPPGLAVCYQTSVDPGDTVGTLDKEEVRHKLVELRKRLERDGSWQEEDMPFMQDVVKALGLDDIDAAYISGDIEELYRKAR